MNVRLFSSILDYPHPGLDSTVWSEDGKLLPEHKEFILSTLEKNLTESGFKDPSAWITETNLVGSLTTYQYLPKTDVDIHMVVDLDKFKKAEDHDVSDKEAFEILDAIRKSWSKKEIPLLPGTKHPLEFFFQTPLTHQDDSRIGVYNINTDKWTKEPFTVNSDFDIEELKPKFVEMANEAAAELDLALGEIRRDVIRIEELQAVVGEWSKDKKKAFEEKINKKIEEVEADIESVVQIREDLVEERHHLSNVESETEVKFKFLQKFGYLYILTQLKDLLKEDGGITEDNIDEVKEIVENCEQKTASKDTHKLMIDFDDTIAENSPDNKIEDPMPGAKEALDALKAEGWTIVIYSVRANSKKGADDIRAYMKEHDLPFDELFIGKPHAEYYIDDRNIVFTSWKDVLKTIDKGSGTKKEAQHGVKYDYSSTQFNLPKDVTQKILEWSVENIPNEDLYDDETNRYGRELESHVTVLYGLTTNDALEVEELLKDEKPVRVKFLKTRHFNTETGDNVNIEVESEDLVKLNKKLSELDHDSLHDEYHPHVSIAYVQDDLGHKYSDKEVLDDVEIELSTLKFSPKEGDPVFIELGKKKNKEAAFMPSITQAPDNPWQDDSDVEIPVDPDAADAEENWPNGEHADKPRNRSWIKQLLDWFGKDKTAQDKTAASDEEYWINPQGQLFDAEAGHERWILENFGTMDLPSSYFNLDIDEDPTEENYELLDKMHGEMVRNGWVRIGSANMGEKGRIQFSVELENMRRIPGFVEDFVASHMDDSGIPIAVADNVNDALVEVTPPFTSLQKAVNHELLRTRRKVAAVPTEQQIDDNTYVKPRPDGAGVIIQVDDLELVPDSLNNWLAKNVNHGDFVTVQDKHGNEITLRYPMRDIKRLIRYKLYAPEVSASLHKTASSRYWIDPNGQVYSVPGTHTAWVGRNAEKLNKKFGYNLPLGVKVGHEYTDILIDNGWVRIGDDWAGNYQFVVDVNDLKNIPPTVDNFIAEHFSPRVKMPIIVGSHSTVLSKNNTVIINDPFPTLQEAVNNELKFSKSSALDKQADPIAEILNLIQSTGGATWNFSQGNLSGTKNFAISIYPERSVILDHEPTAEEIHKYTESNSDLLNDSNNSFGAWFDNSSGKYYLDVVVTIPNRDKAIELGRQHNQKAIFDLEKFEEIPTGGTGEVQAALGEWGGYWISPDGEVHELAEDEEHWDWMDSRDEELGGYTADPFKKGWVRARLTEEELVVQLYDLTNIPPYVAPFLETQDVPVIYFEDENKRNTEISYEDFVEHGLQNAVNSALRRSNAVDRQKAASKIKTASISGSAWVDPNGKAYEFPVDLTHSGWIRQNTNLLTSKYHLKIDIRPTDSTYADKMIFTMLENGWVRVNGYQGSYDATEFSIQVDDLMNPPDALQAFLDQYYDWEKGDPVLMDDMNGNYAEVDITGDVRDDIRKGLRHDKIPQAVEGAEEKHNTTWDEPRQDMEPFKPLPTTFEQSTNDENLNSRYPWRFMRRPNGPDYSDENEVNHMLMEMPISTKHADLQKDANTLSGVWVAPDGKFYDARSSGSRSHGEWVMKNAPLLAKTYGIADAKKRDYFDVAREMLEKGWARIGDTSRARGMIGVEVANIKNLPSYIDDALASFMQDGQPVMVADLNDNWAEVTWPFKSLQQEVRRTFNRRRGSQIEADVNGYWLSPDGKEIKLGPTQEHAKVIKQYGLTFPEAIMENNWVRIRMSGEHAYIEVKDILNIPASVEDFIIRHPADELFIEQPYNGAYVEVYTNDMMESTLQEAIKDELKRRRPSKVAYSLGQVHTEVYALWEKAMDEWKRRGIIDPSNQGNRPKLQDFVEQAKKNLEYYESQGIAASKIASTYTDQEMEKITDEQHKEDLPDDTGPGNSYHDFPDSTTDYPKPRDTGSPKIYLDRLDNTDVPLPSYEVSWFMGTPRGDDTN